MAKQARKLIANNKKVYHDYFLEETFEAGGEGPTTPHAATPSSLHVHGFGLVRFRSPLLAQSRLISVPPGT